MLKVISALLLAAMFIGCSESAKTEEAAPVAEEAAPVAEEANMSTEAAAPVEANVTADAAATPAK